MSDRQCPDAPHDPSRLPEGAGIALALVAALGGWALGIAVWLSGAGLLWAALTLVLSPAITLAVALTVALTRPAPVAPLMPARDHIGRTIARRRIVHA